MSRETIYKSVDELPDLVSKLGQQKTTYNSVDELPDLKKKEPTQSQSSFNPLGNASKTFSGLSKPPTDTFTLSPSGEPVSSKPIPIRVKTVDEMVNEMDNKPISDQTSISRPVSQIELNDRLQREEQHKKNIDLAIDNTTKQYFKNKGIKTGTNSPLYQEQKDKIQKAFDNGDVAYHMDLKTNEPRLDKLTGFWTNVSKGWNEAMDSNDEAATFVHDMNTQERLDFIKKKQQEQASVPPSEYLSERQGGAGLAGHTLGGAAPFLGKAIAGTLTGAALLAAAPETMGASLAGLPVAMSFLYTAPDMVNQGGMNETIRRYNILKKENPELSDIDAMKQAESGLIVGGIGGIAENALFMKNFKAPISQEGKQVIGKFATETLQSGINMGASTAAVDVAKNIEGNVEGYKATPKEIAKSAVNTFTDNATVGMLLHGMVNGVPKALNSAFKFALKDTPKEDIAAILNANVEAGNITTEQAQKTANDIEGYNAALDKTAAGLTPEAKASVAGLIQAKDNIVKEMATKDETQHEPYKKKIEALNKQIEEITKSNDPTGHEIDDITGKPLGEQPTNIPEPIPLKTNESDLIKEYRDKNGVSADQVPDDALLKNIAEQAQNITGGKLNDTGTLEELYKNTVNQAGKDLTDLAIEKYPAQKLLNEDKANEVHQPTEVKSITSPELNKDSQDTEATAEGDKKGITHAAVAELRKLIDLPEYEGKPVETHEQLIADAQGIISKDPEAANKVLGKIDNDKEVSNKDNAVLAVYKATLDAELERNPNKETLERATKLAKSLDISGTKLGKALESRKLIGEEDNLANFLLSKQAAQGTALSEPQIKNEAAKYEELKTAKEALEKQLETEREQHAKDIAELGLNKAKAKARKESKKSDADYKAERKSTLDAAREALKKLRDEGLHSTVPGILELKAIAPHVKEYLNSLASQGIDKLDNAITQIHAEFKDVLEGLTKKDVLNILAGEHDDIKKEPTKNEKANSIRLLKREAALLKELELARKGEEKAKSETKKTASNRRIDELNEKIKEVRQLNKDKAEPEPVKDISADSNENARKYEKKLQNRIDKLNKDLREGNYLKEKEQPPIFKKTRKAQILEDRVIDLENKIRHERSLDEYNKRGKVRKAFDKVMEVLGIRRIVQSAVDMSVPFRQGATLISPRRIDVWAKGFKANLQSIFSPKKFERIMHEIRNDSQYHEMLKDNIVYNDLGSADPNLHNEDFRKSFIYDIPIISEPLKASNRSADAFLNVVRYEMYKKMRANLEMKGLTRESDPKDFQYMGNWVMSMTGRGKMHSALEKPAMNAVLGNTFYGARLMASRFNLLNPVTYLDPRVSKAAKFEAAKDLMSFTVTTMAVGLALSKTTGAKISVNPDDSDFLQLRYGDKVYDISGGLANYVRTALRIVKAGYTKATGSKYAGSKATENAGTSVLNFFRNKLSPNTAYATDAFFGGRYGQQFDPTDIYRIYPMYTEDFMKALKEDGGLMATTTVLLPNIIGVGYGSYASKGQIDKNLDDLLKRNLRSDEMNNEKIYNYNDGGRQVTFKEFDDFANKRDAEIEKDIKVLYEKGIGKTPYKDLTQEQVADEIKYIKATATRQVKEELFGKEKRSRADKKETKKLSKEHEQKYKNN